MTLLRTHCVYASINEISLKQPASGRDASVSACAGLTNQLQSCWVDPRIAWKKHGHSNCKRPGEGGVGIPRPVLLTGVKKFQSGVSD